MANKKSSTTAKNITPFSQPLTMPPFNPQPEQAPLPPSEHPYIRLYKEQTQSPAGYGFGDENDHAQLEKLHYATNPDVRDHLNRQATQLTAEGMQHALKLMQPVAPSFAPPQIPAFAPQATSFNPAQVPPAILQSMPTQTAPVAEAPKAIKPYVQVAPAQFKITTGLDLNMFPEPRKGGFGPAYPFETLVSPKQAENGVIIYDSFTVTKTADNLEPRKRVGASVGNANAKAKKDGTGKVFQAREVASEDAARLLNVPVGSCVVFRLS